MDRNRWPPSIGIGGRVKSESVAAMPRNAQAIQVHCRERPLWDRKADIAYEEIIVRRGNRFDYPLSQAKADVGRVAPPSRLVAEAVEEAPTYRRCETMESR